jgi:hypothetical protein
VQRVLAVGLLTAFALVTAACGAARAPSDEVAAAGEVTKDAGSARIETVARVAYGSPMKPYEVRWTELVDYRRNRSTTVDHETGCRTIVIGDRSYSELPPDDALPPRKRWAAWGGADEDVDAEALFEQTQGEQATNEDGSGIIVWSTSVGVAVSDPEPHDYLEDLRESATDVHRIAEEDVHGVPTTRYRAEIDRERLTRDALEADGWKAENVERYLDELEETKEEVEVWIDTDGLVRRIVRTETPLEREEGSVGGWTTTTEFFDFGIDVDVEAPPVAEVIDSEEWARIGEEQMQEELEAFNADPSFEVPLPGAFEPSVAPSCLD